ncbi:MAG: site-specific integrase [Raineya sp.]
MKNIKFETTLHHNKPVIFLHFEYDEDTNNWVKSLRGVKWSSSKRAWYVRDTPTYRKKFGLELLPLSISSKSYLRISPINRNAYEKLIDTLRLKGYSESTIKTYQNEFAQLLILLKDKNVDDLIASELRGYFLYCINTLKLAENTLHSRMNAIKFYFEQVLKREKVFLEIPRPQRPSKLPKAISQKDIKKIFDVTTNLKHNTMLKLCYGMGLRVSEIVHIKITDIDSGNMQVLVERAKGKKDRYVNLPQSILEQLRAYYLQYKPKKYLFEGMYGEQYSIRSVQKVFKNALAKAKINKKVGIHSLRHSFATHLLEQGTDVRFIQELLGHKDIKTTLVYTQVGNKAIKKVQSPLDNL